MALGMQAKMAAAETERVQATGRIQHLAIHIVAKPGEFGAAEIQIRLTPDRHGPAVVSGRVAWPGFVHGRCAQRAVVVAETVVPGGWVAGPALRQMKSICARPAARHSSRAASEKLMLELTLG